MQICAAPPPSAGGLFACELDTAMRLNRVVLGEAWASRAPLGVEAVLAHLLAIDAQTGWAVALLEENPMASVDMKQLDRLVRSLNRVHRTRRHRRRTRQVNGAAETQACREAVDSTANQNSPGSVALCALIQFLEQLRTPLVNPELMPRVVDHFRSAGPLSMMDMSTRHSVCQALHGHTQLGLLDDAPSRALVEQLAAFAHDFAVVHATVIDGQRGGLKENHGKTDSRILAQLCRILGPRVLRSVLAARDDNVVVTPEPEGQPTGAEAGDIFQLMALETGFIFGDDPHPGGVSSSDAQTTKRRQHHRVNSWLVSQQLDPIHEEFELLSQQQPQPWQPGDQRRVGVLKQQEEKNQTAASVSPDAKNENSAPVTQETPSSTCSDATISCCDTSYIFTFMRKWKWAGCLCSRWQWYDWPIDSLTLSLSNEGSSYKWHSLVCSAIILTVVVAILLAVVVNWLTVPETESRLCASSSFWPLSTGSESVSDLVSAVSVPRYHHHYMMLQSWAGDRAVLIASIVQSLNHLLGTVMCRIRTVAYSFVDDLLLAGRADMD